MNPDELTNKDQTIIDDEVARYEKIYQRIQEAFKNKTYELTQDEQLARKLTAEIVAARKDEEKQFLQSDEQVAHGLAHLRFKQTHALSDLTRQPYFARVIYNEKNRDVEFKLGVASFPEERIIDWRKAPISKLYYDYEEGDGYEDEIAGVERQGQIKLKRAYRGRYAELSNIELKDVSYVKSHSRWCRFLKQAQVAFSVRDKEKVKKLLASHAPIAPEQLAVDDGYLAQILSLLSPEQFCLISSDVSHPVIIQGSAGTGKTTVALHRLAWLLFEGNSPAQEANSLVVMFNPTLASYVKNILPSLGVHKVKIATYFEWARDVIRSSSKISFTFRSWDVPAAVTRFKSDQKTFENLRAFADTHASANPQDVLDGFYQDVIARSATTEVIYIKEQLAKKFFDSCDLAPLLELIFIRDGVYSAKSFPAAFDHLVIDEAQDFTVPEIKTLLHGLADKRQLTIAGDLGQKILEHRDFGTWMELLEKLGLKGVDVLNLSIAYRSTYQVYEIAEYIRNPAVTDEDLKMFPKFGPDPKLTIAHNFSEAIELTGNWIEEVININQKAIGAIICRTPQEARQVFVALAKVGVPGIRHGDAQHFEFTPGITVTDVRQVKGLEFQFVLIFNPAEKAYPSHSAQDRNLLYVAVTRAVFRLDFVCYETATAILPEFINTQDLTAVVAPDDDSSRFLFDSVEMREEREDEKIKRAEAGEDVDEGDMVDELLGDEEIDDDSSEDVEEVFPEDDEEEN